MAKTLLFSLALLLFLYFATATQSEKFQPSINVWPLPRSLSWPKPTWSPLSPFFDVVPPLPHNPPLCSAIRRYMRMLSTERHRPLIPPSDALVVPSPVRDLLISVVDPFAPLHHGVDESYTLSVYCDLVNITAATPWGAMRGLETLSQLAVFAGGHSVLLPTDIEIIDKPLFPHRGLLLDTARNYYSVDDILRTIRAMSYNKLNVFHWHITDSQSFPLLLPSEPELALKGSYGQGMRYSPEDVRRIVNYAGRHGIRVVPEIDSPGHAGSWAEAYPEIVTCANKFWVPADGPPLAAEPGTGQLNPLNPKTYDVIRNVVGDVADLFSDSLYHAGGDEVNTACWEDDSSVRDFFSKNGTHDQLLELFINNTYSYIASLKRTAVYWEDVLLSSRAKVNPSLLPTNNTIMQTWNNGVNNTKKLTGAGYRVIVSSADFYYLDCGHGGWLGNDSRYNRQESDPSGKPFNYAGGNGGSWCAPFKSWQRVYDYDITYGLSEKEAKLVLGGEVALWSEQSDGMVVDERLWPRAAAMAEALWSGNRDSTGKKRYATATDRLNEWRFRMVGRGIRAEPIQPLWCVRNPGMCNLSQ